jgi:hypothetical protein
MSQLGVDLRAYLLTDSAISTAVGATRIHQNHVPEGYGGLYIWFGRSGTEDEDALDDSTGSLPFREFFDLEVIGRSLGGVLDCAEEVASHHKHKGAMGTGSVQLLRIFDHEDDYIPRGVFDDELGLHYAAFQVEVTGYSPA